MSNSTKGILFIGVSLFSFGIASFSFHLDGGMFRHFGEHSNLFSIIILGALVVGLILIMLGSVFWFRAKNAPPIIPPLTLWHLLAIQGFLVFFIFMNFNPNEYLRGERYVERYYGWPLPAVIIETNYTRISDRTLNPESQSHEFSIEHLRAHPHLYSRDKDSDWHFLWRLFLIDTIFVIIIVVLTMQSFNRWFPVQKRSGQ